MPRDGRSRWYRAGCAEGEFAAEVNVREPDSVEELKKAIEEDRVGEVCGQIREHQVQMAGDVSYDVDKPGGPTEEQYERWEDGFCACFDKGVRAELAPKREARAAAPCLTAPMKTEIVNWLHAYRFELVSAQAENGRIDAVNKLVDEVRALPEC